MIERLLCKVKPDYVQYDCKGHPGYTGYPTKVGWASPGIKKDSLRVWRKVTQRHGIALFVHYSGLWDEVAIRYHPEWACINVDGKRDDRIVSFFSPYVDKILILQLKEIIDLYDVEGVWIDGDCWAAKPDWSKKARREFKEITGVKKVPRKPNDLYWDEWINFQRRKYLEYVEKVISEIHKHKPNFEIAINWLYTTFAPLPINVQVDLLSGDVTPESAVDRLRFEARYLASTEMTRDLMSWGFTREKEKGRVFKPAIQLMQEAAIVISQGGGYSIYYQPTRSGWIDDWIMENLARVAEFCRKRQEVSHKTETVPQAALLLSSTEYLAKLNKAGKIFGPLNGVYDSIQGVLHALLELHYSVDVLAEHHVYEKLQNYPLVVIPEWEILSEEIKELLIDYTKRGGSLLLIGANTALIFKEYLGVEFIGEPIKESAYIRSRDVLGWLGGLWQSVKPLTAECIGLRFSSIDTRKEAKCVVTLNRLGKGTITAIYGPLGTIYYHLHVPAIRDFLGNIVKQIFQPIIKVWGPPCVDVVLRRKEEKLLIHLINVAGRQVSSNYVVIDFIPPLGPLKLSIRLVKEPRKVYIVPYEGKLLSKWRSGNLIITLQRLNIHSVVVIEF